MTEHDWNFSPQNHELWICTRCEAEIYSASMPWGHGPLVYFTNRDRDVYAHHMSSCDDTLCRSILNS